MGADAVKNIAEVGKGIKMAQFAGGHQAVHDSGPLSSGVIQQIDHYDLFPRIGWSRRAKVDYLLRIGLAVLLEMFREECEKRPNEKPNDWLKEYLGHMKIARVLETVNKQKLPKSDVMRLLDRSLFGTE